MKSCVNDLLKTKNRSTYEKILSRSYADYAHIQFIYNFQNSDEDHSQSMIKMEIG